MSSNTKPLIAWLPAGQRNTASSRLRAYTPCRYVRRAGWRCEIFNPVHASRYEIVVVQKRYDENSLALVRELQAAGTRVIFDLCDNHFHYELDKPEALKHRSQNLDRMLEAANQITVSTPTLGEVVSERSGRGVAVIDDMLEIDRLNPLYRLWGRISRMRDSLIRMVWFGIAGMKQPPFGLIDLGRILPVLEEFNDRLPASLTVISNSRRLADRYLKGSRLRISYKDWHPRWFPFHLSQSHIAVIPINRNPLTICKTSNRLALSLQLGVAVVADSIPSYEEFSEYTSLSNWQDGLLTYAQQPHLRRDHVRKGASLARSRFAPQRVATQWQNIFQRLL